MRNILFFLLFSPAVFAQSVPIKNTHNQEVPLLIFERPAGIDELLEREVDKNEFFEFGRFIYCDMSPKSHGEWTLNADKKTWRLALNAKDSKGISLYFDQFWIPSTGSLTIYNADKSKKIGPFTSKHNHNSGVFATELINDETIILEYVQPHSESDELILHIDKFVYAYRSLGPLNGYNTSQSCEVNANCSEGDDWHDQKKSICRIQIPYNGGVGLCTGSLINNTSNNCTPYVLSADHCFNGGNISSNSLNQSIFYFNYYSEDCANSVPVSTKSITGCQKVSNSGNQGANGDSDFFLVKLNSEPDFDPFYSGWDRTNVAANSGVGIHHPNGDIMKISTYNSSLVSSFFGSGTDNTTHWKVIWSQTDNGHGVTEGGSSGSPIFNQNKHIVGHLTGGGSYCMASTSPDVYGKVWHAWDQMGIIPVKQLKFWLDSLNTGVTTLDGSYCNRSDTTSIANNQLMSHFDVYPNPTEGRFNLLSKDHGTVMIYNMLSELVYRIEKEENSMIIELSKLTPGIYFIHFNNSIKKLILH